MQLEATRCKTRLVVHSDGAAPRRVVSVGYCIGGGVSTLAAAWAGVQWPTADVRCITFGAPAVGNAAFVAAFRYDIVTHSFAFKQL